MISSSSTTRIVPFREVAIYFSSAEPDATARRRARRGSGSASVKRVPCPTALSQ